MIDTAEMYADGGSERLVGEAIAGHRDDVFLVSKAYPQNASQARLRAACQASASVEQLTSHSLVELRDLIAKARSQRTEVDQDLAEAHATYQAESAELERRQQSWFRWFMKGRIAELEGSVPEAASEVQRLTEWQGLSASRILM